MADDSALNEELDLGPIGLAGYTGQVVPYEARGAIIRLFESRDDEVVLSGPAGTGKSRGAIEKLHYLLSEFPRIRVLMVRKTLRSLTESGLVTYRQHVLHVLDGVHFYGGSKSKPAMFMYPNGSELLVGGLDQVSKVMSTDYDVVYVQEVNEITEAEFEMLTTRLRNNRLPFQQIICDVNPQEPWNWVLRRSQRGDLLMLESRHEDNPRLYDRDGNKTPEGEVYLRRLERLTGVRLQRLRYGRWVAAEGIVYESYDANIHLIKGFVVPKEWRRIRSIDFGFVNPFTCQWWAINPDRDMFLYREWYRTHTIVADHAKRINELTGKQRIEATVADHDSEDRATLHAEGIRTQRAKKPILRGIEAVERRMRLDSRGKPHLYIMDNALVNRESDLAELGKPTCLSEEVNSYAWPPDAKKGKVNKELPLDENNHACDAMRYAVMYVDGAIRSAVPSGGTSSGGSKWVNKHSRID